MMSSHSSINPSQSLSKPSQISFVGGFSPTQSSHAGVVVVALLLRLGMFFIKLLESQVL
jgi:hypothetical protein